MTGFHLREKLGLTPTIPSSESDHLGTATTPAESSVPTDGGKGGASTTVDDEAASKYSSQGAAPPAAPSGDTAEVLAPLNPGANVPSHPSSPKPPANLLGFRILDKAISALEPGERAVVEKYAALRDPAQGFDEAYAAAETCKKKYKDKGVWTIKGHKIEWRTLVGNVLKFLDKFKNVGDFLADLDPAHAGIPWAVVKILLTVSC
ncbi:hypothetical protein MMC10_010682 [Thelotrema lepadinum]|nr:hypothetical protein [Thelotrema lepadinum]